MGRQAEAGSPNPKSADRRSPPRPKPGLKGVPRMRTLLIAIAVGVLVSMLVIDAYMSSSFTPDPRPHTSADTDEVPQSVRDGGPIIDTTQGRTQTYRLPAKTMALTFDDGPSPEWTPKILAVLRKHHVNATFFLIGAQVMRYPGITKQMVTDHNEIGSHTFTHADLSTIPDWRRGVEYAQTQMALAAAAGTTTSLLRYPYSSGNDAISNDDWPVTTDAGRRGYLTVLTDIDSDDWKEHSVKAILHNATPVADEGAIVLMHDSGGDRSQTVAALDRFIPLMQAKGYKFVTVTEGLRLALAAGTTGTADADGANGANAAAGSGAAAWKIVGDAPATSSEIWRGRFLMWAVRAASGFLRLLEWLFIAVGALTIARTLLLFGFGGYHAFTRRRRKFSWGPPVTAPVSVVVPAFNEKEGIVATVRSLAGGDYPVIDVVVVDDGSTDGTGDLVENLKLPNVRVIRVPNGGKPYALNVGIAYARHDLIVMVDGDTVLEPDAIRHLVQPFANPEVGAVSGNVKVGNRAGLLSRWQHIEYVIGFNLDRRLYDVLRCMPTIPGAIGAFRRTVLRQVRGVSSDTLAEDTDLTMAICRAGWRVVYTEDARAWTEAPATLKQLTQQRYRWSYGTMQAMWKHRRSLIEKGPSGHFGRVGLPLLSLFGVALPLLAPLFDVVTVYGLIVFNQVATGIAWLGMLGLQFLTAIFAFRLDKEKLRPLWALPLQQFVYRQIMYLVIIRSTLTAITGARMRWQKLRRTGQSHPPAGRWRDSRSGEVVAR